MGESKQEETIAKEDANECCGPAVTIYFAGLCMFLGSGGKPTGKETATVLLLDPSKTGSGLCRHDPVLTMPRGALFQGPEFEEHVPFYSHWADRKGDHGGLKRFGKRLGMLLPLRGRRILFETSPPVGSTWDTPEWKKTLSLETITGWKDISDLILPARGLPAPVVAGIVHLPPGTLSISQLSSKKVKYELSPRDEPPDPLNPKPLKRFAVEMKYEFPVENKRVRLDISTIGGSGRQLIKLQRSQVLGISNVCPSLGKPVHKDLLYDPDVSAYYELVDSQVPHMRRNVLWNTKTNPGVTACPPSMGGG